MCSVSPVLLSDLVPNGYPGLEIALLVARSKDTTHAVIIDDDPGRQNTGQSRAARPTGQSDARFSTGINPDDENPIDPSSPDLPPA